jgi:anti-sigma factor RsiW
MRCYRARRWLSAYLDDELDPRRRASLDAHLAGCKACKAELERLKQQWDALVEGDRVPPVPADLWGQILTALDQAESLPWHRRYRARLLQAACVTACVVLGFTGGAILSWRQPPAVKSAPEIVSTGERTLVAEAFDVTAFGLAEGKEGLLRCVPK